jgi:hypothetical protein
MPAVEDAQSGTVVRQRQTVAPIVTATGAAASRMPSKAMWSKGMPSDSDASSRPWIEGVAVWTAQGHVLGAAFDLAVGEP